ncbi:MAG: stress response translation initiation inhibitor YciH [Candidatus Nanoarchaeia archaeon]|nr:stress response translation initiation inhibitor YciH [Candidatus Nanoarchaeia archaeon]MDD5587730.1 stress response translation initiation inhibitor YciH [Candidatus Nanoarchaeia archaeon]
MSEICDKCGLPKDLCVCEVLAKEKQKIKIKTVERSYGKKMTIVEGLNKNDVNIKELATKLKSSLACGGTLKDGIIELQGNHKEKVKQWLVKFGFNADTIEVQ